MNGAHNSRQEQKRKLADYHGVWHAVIGSGIFLLPQKLPARTSLGAFWQAAIFVIMLLSPVQAGTAGIRSTKTVEPCNTRIVGWDSRLGCYCLGRHSLWIGRSSSSPFPSISYNLPISIGVDSLESSMNTRGLGLRCLLDSCTVAKLPNCPLSHSCAIFFLILGGWWHHTFN